MSPDYPQSLDDLEAVRVPFESQGQTQATEPPRDVLEPEDFDRMRLLSDPAGAGRLRPRG